MNYKLFFAGILSMMAISCSIDEIAAPEETEGSKVFYAYIDDQPRDVDTKVQVTDLTSFNRIVWNVDDRITIFNKDTYNREFIYKGKDLDNKGSFKEVPISGFITYNPLGDRIYAIYPYKEETDFDDVNDCITFEFPDVQNYLANSFSRGANTMVSYSATGSNELSFKNAGGYLSFKLWGDNVTVSSVILKGNGGELLAGTGAISIDSNGLPVVEMASGGKDEVSIWCEDPVLLGTSAENYTEFCFVLPPVAFSAATNGFTLYVTTPDGKVFSRKAKMDLSIERNMMNRMDPLKVTPSTPQSGDIAISKISSNAGGYGAGEGFRVRQLKSSTTNIYTQNLTVIENEVTPDANNTFSITLPTVTDFSELYLNFYGLQTGDKLLVDGKEVTWSFVNNVAKVGPIDASGPSDDKYKPASKPVTLTVRRGYAEKRYTLDAKNTGLPVVRINTTGFNQSSIDGAHRDSTYRVGFNKYTVDNRVWRPVDASDGTATIIVESADGKEVNSYDTQIKGRGNATWGYNKRPYALKLSSDNSILGMPSHNRWILLANWKDRTLLRNDAAFWLSEQTQLPYTVRGEFVELEFNGVHRGNYYLCEQIKIDKNRVNITKPKKGDTTGPYLMEIDNNFDEDYKFKSTAPFSLKYMFKQFKEFGEDDVLSDEQLTYMTQFITTLENELKNASSDNHNYANYIDIDSAIWFMFVNELTGNGDFYNDGSSTYKGPHSTYLYKDVDKDGTVSKLFMGPVWDFDYLTFIPSRSNMWAGFDEADYYYSYMCQDPIFTARMVELWNIYAKMNTGKPEENLKNRFETYVLGMADHISLSEPFNTAMWGYSNTGNSPGQQQDQNGDNNMDFMPAVLRAISALKSKADWMNNYYNPPQNQ